MSTLDWFTYVVFPAILFPIGVLTSMYWEKGAIARMGLFELAIIMVVAVVVVSLGYVAYLSITGGVS